MQSTRVLGVASAILEDKDQIPPVISLYVVRFATRSAISYLQRLPHSVQDTAMAASGDSDPFPMQFGLLLTKPKREGIKVMFLLTD